MEKILYEFDFGGNKGDIGMEIVTFVYTFEFFFQDDETDALQVELSQLIEFFEACLLGRQLVIVGLKWLF